MLVQNLAYRAILRGCIARSIDAGPPLDDIAAQETGQAIERARRRDFEPTTRRGVY